MAHRIYNSNSDNAFLVFSNAIATEFSNQRQLNKTVKEIDRNSRLQRSNMFVYKLKIVRLTA